MHASIRYLAAAAMAAIMSTSAHADVLWNWTFTSPTDNGSGTFVSDDLSAGNYLITSITGTWRKFRMG